MKFRRKIGTALGALNDVTDELTAVELANSSDITYYIVGSAGIASGQVTPESAHTKAYAGTWAPEVAAFSVPASTVKKVTVTGIAQAGRVRCTTVFVGGTFDVWAMGK